AAYGATVSYSLPGVQAGQTYLIRASGNSAGDSTGGFGLEVNFGSASQPPIPPPNTVVLQQPDQGGGSSDTSMQVSTAPPVITIGNLSAPGDVFSMSAPNSPWGNTPWGNTPWGNTPWGNTAGVRSSSAGATQVGTTDAVTPL